MRAILVFCWAVLCAAAFFLAAGAQLAEAAPSTCMFPGTTGRAVKVLGNGPAACALSQCRSAGLITSKVVPCQSGPGCANQFPYVEQWRAEAGAWSGLAACPTWTNSSVWQ